MQCMVASSIPCKISLCADRAHACAGDSYVSSGIDVACPTTQNVFAIASPHELQGDSWPSSSTGTSSFCCNQQYSITAVTTSTGTIAERYAYSAYGQPTILDASVSVLSSSAINNRYTYTGREWDATLGLHHFRARWMSGLIGRFLTRDPIGFEGSKWNLNEFCRGSPAMSIDPTGNRWLRSYAVCVLTDSSFNDDPDDCHVICSYACQAFTVEGGGDPNKPVWGQPKKGGFFNTEEVVALDGIYCGSCRELASPLDPNKAAACPIRTQSRNRDVWIPPPLIV